MTTDGNEPAVRWRGRGIGPARYVAALGVVMALTGCTAPTHQQAATKADVTRARITLAAEQREHFLAGMRTYLQATQGIVDGLASNKMSAVAKSARSAGMSEVSGVSPGAVLGLPSEFVSLAIDTHQKFDALATAAEQNASRKELLDRLGAILGNCSACHAMYRVAD